MTRLIGACIDLCDRHGILRRPHIRAVLALAWTLLLTVLLVQPSSQPVIGPPAPPGPPSLARETMLTLGHIVGFSMLVMLWWWALSPRRSLRRSLFVAVGFALIFGALTELAQIASANRSPSLVDLIVNWGVTAATAVGILIERRRA